MDTLLIGKDRQFHRRFLTLANHDLFEPVACTPEAGGEKGQVENQVGNVREWLFTPRLKFTDFTALNTWLANRCQELAGRRHPTELTRTIAECFADEQPLLRPVTAPFEGSVEQTLRVSRTGLIRVDRHRDRVPAVWAGKVVSVRLTADALRVVAEGQIIAEHPRHVGRDPLLCDPWHSLPLLEKKPGALRHGIPFQAWDLPNVIRVVRDRLLKAPKGDRAFVERWLLARELGREVLEVACELTLETGVISAPVVINARRRLAAPVWPTALDHPPTPTRRLEPLADGARDDRRREVRDGH